ncbi:phospholipase A1 PLIP2, chloroplastic-like [Magnolia sinica]|uniref:phospholipase A1 PLIP2, chloroplastic-like n=1 Tax=Magnolia sinica TaxID=86752 RepID=UPI0026581B18|nr:phospholipase A1 PLIP2, chloroplastic-like [Magnolia sinica]
MGSLGLKSGGGAHGISLSTAFVGGPDIRTHPAQVSTLGRGSTVSASSRGISMENASSSSGRHSFASPLTSLWFRSEKGNDETALEDSVVADGGGDEGEEEGIEGGGEEEEFLLPKRRRSGNWVLKILRIGSLWAAEKARKSNTVEERKDNEATSDRSCCDCCCCCGEEGSDVCGVGYGEEEVEGFERESFSKMLRRVSLAEARAYAQMSYLGNLAYRIPKIKPGNLLKYHGLHFVTSSLEKKAQSANAEMGQTLSPEKKPQSIHDQKEQISNQVQELEKEVKEVDETREVDRQRKIGHRISALAAFQIAATAASYLHSRTRSILPFRSTRAETTENFQERTDDSNQKMKVMSSEVASFVVTTNSVTAVVAGKEEMKQAVAKDLSSAKSSPCEWFICDDGNSTTRFFVIQGSESLASWQANLLFEPIQFEGLNVLVHRGIYEAAKGIYEQMLPEVRAHLRSHGDCATLRFTGHSLGGSLSLLVNLMLLIRGEAPPSSLLPVVTFGSPSIMCGGEQLLHELGLPRSHVQAITMHRDIVPRAFSCSYPDHVADLLKAVNGNFRNHPCLQNQKLLYAPMGELLILQPDEKFSPHHHLLPAGSGLYRLSCPVSDSGDSARQLQVARAVFFNSPHPLEILSDPSAYGSDGAIYRDHDMNSYLQSVRCVIHQELKHIRKAKRESRRQAWWPLVGPPQGFHASIVIGLPVELGDMGQQQLSFSSFFHSRQESWKWFSRLVASQPVRILIVLIFPVRLLLQGTFAAIGFH